MTRPAPSSLACWPTSSSLTATRSPGRPRTSPAPGSSAPTSAASRFSRPAPRPAAGLYPLLGESPVQDPCGGLSARRRAGGGPAEDDADQRAAAALSLEEQAVPGRVGVPGLDAVGTRIRADQVVG